MSSGDTPQISPRQEHEGSSAAIRTLLEVARRHLGMDLTFLGEFVGDREVYQTVVGDGTSFGLAEGAALPLPET